MEDERAMKMRMRDDNRGGRPQGSVVEVPCEGQIVGSAVRTPEGNSKGSSRMLAEARDADAKQKTEAIIEQAVSKFINSVPGIPPESEFGATAHRPVNKFGGQFTASEPCRRSIISVTE